MFVQRQPATATRATHTLHRAASPTIGTRRYTRVELEPPHPPITHHRYSTEAQRSQVAAMPRVREEYLRTLTYFTCPLPVAFASPDTSSPYAYSDYLAGMPMAVLSSLFILTTYLYTTPRTTYLDLLTCPCPPPGARARIEPRSRGRARHAPQRRHAHPAVRRTTRSSSPRVGERNTGCHFLTGPLLTTLFESWSDAPCAESTSADEVNEARLAAR